MRRIFSRSEALESGLSKYEIRAALRTRQWQCLLPGVYLAGAESPTEVDRAVAIVVATGGIASHSLAGVLHKLDGALLGRLVATIPVSTRTVHVQTARRLLEQSCIANVDGIPTTDELQTLIDLASEMDEIKWEQALECVLRRSVTTFWYLWRTLDELRPRRIWGAPMMRQVLARRGDVPPTESLLETLMIQLIREFKLPTPERQVEVFHRDRFVARVDLAWPDLGVFVELDGQQHKDQPVYDSRRETAVVAATGWLPGRFTWHEVTVVRRQTANRLRDVMHASQLRSGRLLA